MLGEGDAARGRAEADVARLRGELADDPLRALLLEGHVEGEVVDLRSGGGENQEGSAGGVRKAKGAEAAPQNETRSRGDGRRQEGSERSELIGRAAAAAAERRREVRRPRACPSQ